MTPVPIIEAVEPNTYYGFSHVLHDLSLAVAPGEAVALMGRNGMGKTTTLRSLVGLAPPRRGEVRVRGKNVTGVPPHRIAREGIALVPEGRGVFGNLSTRENLVMAAHPALGGQCDWPLERVLELFPRLGERLRSMGHQLSGGEQQMLTIGRALMTNPELLMLDEATEGLAPLIRNEIWSVIHLIKASGVATIIVDKDFRALAQVADRTLILIKGRIVYDGTPRDLAGKPELQARYLGV